uniref:Uncharacterized protein n=1 Tax=Moniliophthora roreri TaxID=221103 RepID=A0A0W0G9J9_MONRR
MPCISVKDTLSVYSSHVLLVATPGLFGIQVNSRNSHTGRGFPAEAPVFRAKHHHERVKNSYIIVLKYDSPSHVVDSHMNFLQSIHYADTLDASGSRSGVRHVYSGDHIKGYAGRFTDNVIKQLQGRPEVEYIEEDQIVKVSEIQTQRELLGPKLKLTTFSQYIHDPKGGEGVDVYVIDTGIYVNHADFEGRASWGKNFLEDGIDEDGNGHGTHCAGTVASRTYGVAKAANVIAVKVLYSEGSGSISDVDWAASSARTKMQKAQEEFRKTGKSTYKGSVANLSLGGPRSEALDTVVNAAADSGLHIAVAAGNDDRNACRYSPPAAEKAVTVGASTITDEKAYFSNHGPCVDIFAPGANVKSTTIGNDDVSSMSGTSMASPHVVGVIAYLLSLYPSGKLNAVFPAEFKVDTQKTFSTASLYSIAHSALPRFISGFLPDPSLFGVATMPVLPFLAAATMKQALLSLGTPDLLSDLPENTVNLLLFNNVTA